MITPVDIENKVFKKVKFGSGYDIDDVEDFLEEVLEDYENIFKENSELKDKITILEESVDYYKSLEDGINETIEKAQTSADKIKEEALTKAQSMMTETEYDLKVRLDRIKNDIERHEVKLEEVKKQMKIYKIKVGSMLEAQLKILNEDEENDEI